MKLDHYVSQIATIFREEKDRYKAHEKATPVLKEMGADPEVLEIEGDTVKVLNARVPASNVLASKL